MLGVVLVFMLAATCFLVPLAVSGFSVDEHKQCSNEFSGFFFVSSAIYEAIVISGNIFLSFKLRNFEQPFNEAKQIAFATYTFTMVSLSVAALRVIQTGDDVNGSVRAFEIIGLNAGVLTVVLCLYFPKFWYILSGVSKKAIAKKSSKGTTDTTTNNTTTEDDGGPGPSINKKDRKIYKDIKKWQMKREQATSQYNQKSLELSRLIKGMTQTRKQIKELERNIAEYSAELQYLQDQAQH